MQLKAQVKHKMFTCHGLTVRCHRIQVVAVPVDAVGPVECGGGESWGAGEPLALRIGDYSLVPSPSGSPCLQALWAPAVSQHLHL